MIQFSVGEKVRLIYAPGLYHYEFKALTETDGVVVDYGIDDPNLRHVCWKVLEKEFTYIFNVSQLKANINV